MKTILATAATIGLLASTSAHAAEKQININANVEKACGVGNHSSGGNTPVDGYTFGDTITVNGDLADANGQLTAPKEIAAKQSFGNFWCNSPAAVKFEVSALKTTNTTTDTGSFTNRLDLEVITDMGVYLGSTQAAVITTSGTENGVRTVDHTTTGAFETGNGHFSGVTSIKVLPSPSSSSNGFKRPVAGSYTGYIKFTASPSV